MTTILNFISFECKSLAVHHQLITPMIQKSLPNEKNIIIINNPLMPRSNPSQHSLIRQIVILIFLVTTTLACSNYASCDPRCNGYCLSASSTTNYDCCNPSPTGYVCKTVNVYVAGIGSASYYQWYGTNTCSNYCPPGYYIPNIIGSVCGACNSWCATCTGASNTQCTSCTSSSYQLNSTACYNYAASDHNYNLNNPCLDGYYGVQITHICTACPTGCAQCYIYLNWQMPGGDFATSYNQHNINCTNDVLCGYTLQCYSCNSGYTLINYFCQPNTVCFTYSYYTSSGAAFTTADCTCFPNFQLLGLSICYKCSIVCLTCSSSTNSSCLSCPTGSSVNGTTCSYNTTYLQIQNWASGFTSSTSAYWSKTGGSPVAGVTTGICSQANYVFGYYGYNLQGLSYYSSSIALGANLFPTGATLSYSRSSVTTAHYGIHIRATLLFIDQWTNGMSILFREGGLNRFSFDYQMQGVPGQYLCGLNYYDHHDVVDNWFSHTNSAISLSILTAYSGYAWGIKELIMHVLKCHSSCTTCNGPLISNCLSCPTNQILVNNVCVCNSTGGYYNLSGNCVTDCGSLYKNSVLYSCVSSCSFPNLFVYNNLQCVVTCPSGYQNYNNYFCVSTCYNNSNTVITTNYFNFDGKNKKCYNVCPTGTSGDPTTGNCVQSCPTYNNATDDGYFSYNSFCYESCPSSTFAFVPQRACLSSCPSGYYKNYVTKSGVNSTVCEQKCSITLSGQFHYGDNTTGKCTDYCSTGSFGDIKGNLCVTYCNNSAFGQSLTVNGSVQRLCVTNCSLTDNLFGNPITGMCVAALSCPTSYYGDPLTYQCTLKCSNISYFGDNSTKLCTNLTCANSAFRKNDTQICVKTCVNNNTNNSVSQYGDSTTGYCITTCYGSYFGDPQFNMQCVLTCSASPSSTFGLNFLCVKNCSNTTWADPYSPNRICTTSCTNNPTNQTYGLNNTRTCVFNCPDGQFAHNISNISLCTYLCTNDSGYFGNVLNNRCQATCPSPYYGDQTGNRTCVLKCPWPYYAQNCSMNGSTIILSVNRVCMLDCSVCGWADNSSQTCAWTSAGCANFTFAHETNHQCVVSTGCTGFGDPLTRYCIPICYSNSSVKYFGDNSTKMCVLVCPLVPNYFGDNATNQCVSTCSNNEVRDWQFMRRCVNITNCSKTPVLLFGDANKSECVTALNCSDGYWGDNNSYYCINICPGPTLLYADNVTKQCVSLCALQWYAFNVTTGKGVCIQYCPLNQWADNLTVKCTTRCSNLTYGVNYTMSWTAFNVVYTNYGICQKSCPINQFARDADNLCVSNCGADLWGDTISRTCKKSPFDCPDGYYADNATHMCVVPLSCSINNGTQYVADNLTKYCVSKCPASVLNFADMVKYLCVAECPKNYFGFNSTLACQSSCKDPTNNSYDGSYADAQLQICVKICSATPKSTFGQNVTFTCVVALSCPNLTWAEVVVYNRQCVPTCPTPNLVGSNPQMFADNISNTCVNQCPTYSYADLSRGYGMCVYICPSYGNGTLQFADNYTKTCVTVCPNSNSTWGDNKTLSCVLTCPLGSYAQQVPYRYCVAKCAVNTWGEDVKRTCVTSPLMCPTINGSNYYAQNISTMCVLTCPVSTNSTPGYWGQNTTRLCLQTCLLPSGVQSGYQWNATRVCIDICPAEIGQDGSYSDQGMCYYVCITPGYYRDPQKNRSCQPSCTSSPQVQYADNTTMRCLSQCPTFPIQYYAYDGNHSCISSCPSNYRMYAATLSCVSICPNTTFYNADNNQCVSQCPTQTTTNKTLYGDPTKTQPVCVTSSNCPSNYYADDNVGLCVSTCTQNQWIYGKNCVQECPPNYYGNPNTLTCVTATNCPSNYYADNVTITCVAQCSGSFADPNTQTCVDVCPTVSTIVYYSDPYTRMCATTCTNNATIQLIQNLENKTCVSECRPSLFLDTFINSCEGSCSNQYYADNSTRLCVLVCPSAPPLFGENNSYTCVQDCPLTTQFKYIPGRVCVTSCPANYYKQNLTRSCVTYCPNTTYADGVSGYCISDCSPNYASDADNTCQSACASPYFRDPTTYKCVFNCPTYPSSYFQVIQNTDRRCDTSCPSGQYRNYFNYTCVSSCSPSPITFADSTTGSCLLVCSTGFYGYTADQKCYSSCPNPLYADPLTRRCVSKCDPLLGYFGDSNIAIPACVSVCSSGTYADPYTQTCVFGCINSPKMYGFDNGNLVTPVRNCVYSCPYPYLENLPSSKCIMSCTSLSYPYADQAAQACVAQCTSPVYQYSYMPSGSLVNGQCVQFCPSNTFAYLGNNSCLSRCPTDLYGSTNNNTCSYTCTIADNSYADPTNNLCVSTCTHNSTYFSYADPYTRTCVTSCPYGMFGDRLVWQCVQRCTNLAQFADPTTGTCVSQCSPYLFADNTTQTCIYNCSLSTLMYGYTASRICVNQCPLSTLFADDSTRLCVNATSCADGYFGLNSSRVCVAICPTTPDLFGDPTIKLCQYSCAVSPVTYYADYSTRLCVTVCPTSPSLFANNYTQRCVADCSSTGYFADKYTRYCIKVCSIIPIQTFADNSTYQCVAICPIQPNYFASNQTWQCVYTCPSTPAMFADNSTRSCVFYCPRGTINTYADGSTRRCVNVCPGNTYNQNSTRQCLSNCLTGYADPQSKYCIAICPNYSYGDNSTMSCVTACPIYSVQTYAEDRNNMCMYQCLAIYGTYRDPYTKRCVPVCPISQGYFAEPSQRLCMPQCPQSPRSFADFSTRTCVSICPKIPALFAINDTRVCTEICPNGTWSDNISRTCISLCVTYPQTFGDNSTWSCVSTCPTTSNTYADDSTHICVPVCPSSPDYYADNITRTCLSVCPNGTFADPTTRACVTTCPNTYYGQNSTKRCVQGCPWRQFADILIHLCVAKCSVDPIYYGNPNTLKCVPQCPAPISFGNPLTQQCVDYQSNGTSGCPISYFADNVSRLCVQVCPMANNTYGDNSTWKCVSVCPGGSINTFSDNSTMRCVSVCPSYPDFYAQPFSRQCVHYCLAANGSFSGSFSDNSTRTCTQLCPSNPDYYSDNLTSRCVFYCPHYPRTFADNSTRRCVIQCPSTPDIYGDLSVLRCVAVCPANQSTFADYTTRLCVKTCPASPPLYADNITRRCLSSCPNNSYADNYSRFCVAVCPRYPQTYADPSTNRCVTTCPSSPDLYADSITQSCLFRCPSGFFAENTTRRCLPTCLYDVVNYADNYTGRCVSRCPANQSTYGDNQTQRCVSQCPLDQFTYADNITQTCLSICINVTNGGYADNVSRMCLAVCPNLSYGDITTRYCVRYCPDRWYAYDVTNLCVLNCPSPYFADNSTWRCVKVCPVGQNLFGQTINNTCVPICPDGTYASQQNQQCVSRCPNRSQTAMGYDTYGYNTTKQCVEQCPYPLFGYPVAEVCVDSCPNPYYQNYTEHLCYICPVECASCTDPLVCLTCNNNYYLYSGRCVSSCPTFPSITYANPNRVCGTAYQCTQGYYALNSTKSCVQNCPAGYFINVAGQTCDSCMKGCINCQTASACLTCNSLTSVWSNYKCYLFCSALKRFYYTTGCVLNCPTGTYLNLTTCQNCSSTCTTCVISAQNCLICSSGYYRSNGICVSQCPANTTAQYVNGSQTCVSCSIANCAVQPLTFTTTQFVNNFQYNVQIQFNQPVNISQLINNVIKLQQKITSRLLQQTYQYLNYTIIDYGNGLYSFVLNNYNPSSNSQLEVQIVDPTAITTASGQIPQVTRSSFSVDTSNLYTLDTYNSSLDSYIYAVVILSFVLLLLTFWTNHSIWMPMYDLMQLFMMLIFVNSNYPPNLLYCIYKSFGSALTFIPNMFSKAFGQAAYNSSLINNNIYSIMQDASFLRIFGHLYTILIVLVVYLVVILVLSKKSPTKEVKKWAKSFIKETFWKKHLHALVYLFFLPVLAFWIFDMRLYSYLGTSSVQSFSIFSSFIFSILFLIAIVVFCYKLRKIAKDSPTTYLMIQKAYNFIVYQKIVKIDNKNNYFKHENNEVDLTNAREPRINELLVFPYSIETKTGAWDVSQPLVSYLHKFLTAVFLSLSFTNPVIQLFLLILLNIALMCYIIVRKPFFHIPRLQFNNYIYIHNMAVLIIVQIILLVFVFMNSQLDMLSKVTIGNAICALMMEAATVNIIYFIYRFYNYYHHYFWKNFVRSDFFKVNYIVEHLEWTKIYDQQEKSLMDKVKTRAQFLEAIQVQTGQALANMVARQHSLSTNTKQKIKALQLRPSKDQHLRQQFKSIFTALANDKEQSHKSVVSSERLSKQQRSKIRDTIFAEKQQIDQKSIDEYQKLQLIQEQNEAENKPEAGEASSIQDDQTEFQYEYFEEQYPAGTPMEVILKGCKKGEVIL